MANWISSKLKVAESLLQQIDQQAAESLGKPDRSPSPSPSPSDSPPSAPKRTSSSSSSALPLKLQLPSKPPPPPPPPIAAPPPPDPRPPPSDPAVGDGDGDWTELLGSPTTASPPPRIARTKPRSVAPSSPRRGLRVARRPAPAAETARSPLQKEPAPVQNENVGGAAIRERSAGLGNAESESDTGSDSGSSTDSEDERRRGEERRKRREQVMAERAAEAIKERENVVARLEGEKQSLEKILVEAQRQQALEASELQTSMSETMDAVELEKQKHNSTRMEALSRLAKLETTNTELASALATTQWNLETEVTRVAELRQQIEVKELSLEAHRRRMSKTHHETTSLSEVESSKRAELEVEILDAEYSLVYDKIAKLKEKAKKLEENIVITRNEIVQPTEVEVELKRRLAQLSDHLIQKQTQVEALSSEKATLAFRMETVSRLLAESDSTQQATDSLDDSVAGVAGTSSVVDIEAGVWQPYNPARRRAFRDRIKSGQQHLGSVVQQLDVIFSAGLVFLRRNPTAQICALIYLLCLHLWVTYILMSRSKVSDGASSGAVFSLDSINRTSGT